MKAYLIANYTHPLEIIVDYHRNTMCFNFLLVNFCWQILNGPMLFTKGSSCAVDTTIMAINQTK